MITIDETDLTLTIKQPIRVWQRIKVKLNSADGDKIPFSSTWMKSDPIDDNREIPDVLNEGYCPSLLDINTSISI